jgi:hypothetical protein
MGTPTPGVGTITWAASQNSAIAILDEFDNVTTGSGGADAIVQSVADDFAEAPGQASASTAIGQTKPVTLGRCRSVPALRTNLTHHIVSDAMDGIEDIEAVWEAPGVDITADVTEALDSAGFIVEDRGQIVADVKGEKFVGGTTYSAEQGAVADEVLDRNGFSGVLNASDVAALTDEIGIHIYADNSGLIREHLEFALKPLHHAYPEQDGTEYRILTIHDPTGEAADVELEYGAGDIADIERLPTAPPAWRVRVGYQIQWEMLRGLKDGETQDPRLFHRNPWVYAEDTSIQTNYPNALSLSILSPLYDKATAQTRANTLLAIFKVRRDVIRVKLAKKLLYSWIGDYVSVTYPGYGLSGGKVFLCVGVEIDLRGPDVWLTLWG